MTVSEDGALTHQLTPLVKSRKFIGLNRDMGATLYITPIYGKNKTSCIYFHKVLLEHD